MRVALIIWVSCAANAEHKAVVDIFQHPGNTINLSHGDLVFKKGAAADCMFFVREGGVVRCRKSTPDDDCTEPHYNWPPLGRAPVVCVLSRACFAGLLPQY